MAKVKQKNTRFARKQKYDPGHMVVVIVCTIFCLVALIFGSISVASFLKSTRPDDTIAFVGGFAWVFLSFSLFLILPLFVTWSRPLSKKQTSSNGSPAMIGAMAVSGFLLGLAGLALYSYGRITPFGVLGGFGFGLFLMYFAWLSWKSHIKKKDG